MEARKEAWVTRRANDQLWLSRATDDGRILETVVDGEGGVVTIRHDRQKGRVLVRRGNAEPIEREVPDGTFAVTNGEWSAFGLIGERLDGAFSGEVKLLLPESGAVHEAAIIVERTAGGRQIRMRLGSVTVVAELDAANRVRRAAVPVQGLLALPEGARPPAVLGMKPDGVVEELVSVTTPESTVAGVLWSPATAGPHPLAVIVAGSGPTDRHGNNPLGEFGRAYDILAAELAGRGVACLRYDKAGVGASTLGVPASDVTIWTSVNVAEQMVAYGRGLGRFSRVTVVGHSEGGIVAMHLASRELVDAIVLLATPGRALQDVLREQLASRVPQQDLRAFDETVDAWKSGRADVTVPAALASLFRPTNIAYYKSLFGLDIHALAASVNVPATVANGTDDAQVTTEDAEQLRRSNPRFHVHLVPGMNHGLKVANEDPFCSSASEPLAPGLVQVIVGGI